MFFSLYDIVYSLLTCARKITYNRYRYTWHQ